MNRGVTVATAIVLGAVLGVAQVFVFDTVRFGERTVLKAINVGILTLLWWIPGVVVMFYAAGTIVAKRRLVPWIVACTGGAIASASLATLLSFAMHCVPHCTGEKGSLELALFLAIPAGFAYGGAMWLLARLILARCGMLGPRPSPG